MTNVNYGHATYVGLHGGMKRETEIKIILFLYNIVLTKVKLLTLACEQVNLAWKQVRAQPRSGQCTIVSPLSQRQDRTARFWAEFRLFSAHFPPIFCLKWYYILIIYISAVFKNSSMGLGTPSTFFRPTCLRIPPIFRSFSTLFPPNPLLILWPSCLAGYQKEICESPNSTSVRKARHVACLCIRQSVLG